MVKDPEKSHCPLAQRRGLLQDPEKSHCPLAQRRGLLHNIKRPQTHGRSRPDIRGGLTNSLRLNSRYNQIKGLEAGNPNADLGVASLHSGVWTLANGQTISYTDAQNLFNSFQANGAGSSSATAVRRTISGL
jgi:hypothetical protein